MKFLKTYRFALLLGLGLSQLISSAADLSFYSAGKGLYYDQTAGGAPVLKQPFPYIFYAQVLPISNGMALPILTANIRSTSWPTFQTRSVFGLGSTFDLPYTYGSRHSTLDQLGTNFPSGDYQFKIQTRHDGQQTLTVNVADSPYPSTPTIENLSEAQAVDSTNDFTLTWQPFADATEADFILLQLMRSVVISFHTAYIPGTVGALNGTNTSITIPAGTLQPGRAYLGRLIFAHAQGISTNQYATAWGTGFSFSQTDFWLRTQGNRDTTPPIVLATIPENNATNVTTNTIIAFKFSEPLGLNGAAVSANLPGSGPSAFNFDRTIFSIGTSGLAPGSSNFVILNSFPQAPVFCDASGNPLASDTVLTFIAGTNRLNPEPALLTNAQWTASNSFSVDLIGTTNSYALQYSENSSNWINLQTNVAFDGKASFIDPNSSVSPSRIYRAVAR